MWVILLDNLRITGLSARILTSPYLNNGVSDLHKAIAPARVI